MEWGWQNASPFTTDRIQTIEYEGEVLGFALAVEGGGYVVVPAYRELPPVTVYSMSSALDVNADEGFCKMLKEVLSYKIHLLRDYFATPNPPAEWAILGAAATQYRAKWQNYSSDYSTFTKAVQDEDRQKALDNEREPWGRYAIMDIGPLTTSSWHQSAPYNNLCPMGDGGRCVVGCVATATAQILYYHRSPITGIGSHTYWWGGDYSCGGETAGDSLTATYSDPYDWANILDRYTGSETQAQKNAVAELCYEVGVAENMMYGRCGSGAYMTSILTALTTYFGYSNQIDMESRSNYSSGDQWFAMLQTELNFYRPLQYGISGHSIVCDGWRVAGTNQVHMNYGWDDSHNAWYTVDDLFCPWEGCSYMVEQAIRYIIPPCQLTLTMPNGGETWYVGGSDTVRWTSENYSGNITIALNFSYPGGYWQNIITNTPNDGAQPWTVTIPTTTHARIRAVASSNPSMGDTSDADFTITDGNPYVGVSSPNGGESWFVGDPHNITWTSGGVSGNIKIELNRNYPHGSWLTLFASTTNDGTEPWTVTSPLTSNARIRVSSVSQPTITDMSDANFTIGQDNPPVILHDPKDDGEPGDVLFVAGVVDELPGATAYLFWRELGQSIYDSTQMNPTGNPNEYAATLDLLDVGTYEYYIKGTDVGSQTSTTAVYDFELYPSCGTTISYDDGSADRFNWGGAEDFRWAVKFTPTTIPFVLCGAEVAISGNRPDSTHTPFRIEVYSESGGWPGTVLFSDTTGSIGNVVGGLPPGETHWANVVLRNGLGEPLVLNGNFFIAVSNPDTLFYEAFARDTTSTNSGRSFLYDGCLLQWYNENDGCDNCKPGNRMIRALGYYQAPPAIAVYRSGDDAQLHWTSTGAPYYHIYSDTTPFGSYATLEGSTSDTVFFDTGAITNGTMLFYRVTSSALP
jgi:hypothetical protein